jgi:hypothetical protein
MKRLLCLPLLASLLCLTLCISAGAVSDQTEDYAVSNIRWESQELAWDPPAVENVTYWVYAIQRPITSSSETGTPVLLGCFSEPHGIVLPYGRLCKYTDISVATMVDDVEMARVTSEELVLSGSSYKTSSCAPHFKVLSEDTCLLTIAELPANAPFQLFLCENKSDPTPAVIKTGYTDESGYTLVSCAEIDGKKYINVIITRTDKNSTVKVQEKPSADEVKYIYKTYSK